jgi:hypothetical protein
MVECMVMWLCRKALVFTQVSYPNDCAVIHYTMSSVHLLVIYWCLLFVLLKSSIASLNSVTLIHYLLENVRRRAKMIIKFVNL